MVYFACWRFFGSHREASLWLKVLVGLIDSFVCVPGFGRNETRVVSILYKPGLSVFLGVFGYNESGKNMRGVLLETSGAKGGGGYPFSAGARGEINDRCSLLTGRYGSGYRRAFFDRFVPTAVIKKSRYASRQHENLRAANSKQPLAALRTERVFPCMCRYMRSLDRQEVDLQRKFTDRHFAYCAWVVYRSVSMISCYI
jgi:hypothetical protein